MLDVYGALRNNENTTSIVLALLYNNMREYSYSYLLLLVLHRGQMSCQPVLCGLWVVVALPFSRMTIHFDSYMSGIGHHMEKTGFAVARMVLFYVQFTDSSSLSSSSRLKSSLEIPRRVTVSEFAALYLLYIPRYQCPLLSCFLSVPSFKVPRWTQTSFFAFETNRNDQMANWHAYPAGVFTV